MTSKPCEAALSVQMQSNNHSVCVKKLPCEFFLSCFFPSRLHNDSGGEVKPKGFSESKETAF